MKVCILTSSYPQFKHDNAGIFVYNLVKNVALKKAITQFVIAPHSKDSKIFENNSIHKVFRFPYFFPLSLQKLCYGAGIVKNIKQNKILIFLIPFFIIAQFISLLILSKKESFDLVHAHWIIPQGVIACLCKKIFNIPYIVSIHGSDIMAFDKSFNNSVFRKLYIIVLNNAAFVTANSNKTAEIVNRISNLDVEIIPMGVDLDLFNPNQTFKKEKGAKPNQEILFVGRLIDWKGVSYLVDAILKIKSSYPKIILKIIGDGPELSSLQARVKKLKLQKNVIFLKAVPNYKLPDIYRNADVFVIPSIINDNGETEGLGTVALEAMACGVPVIGTNVGGIPDIIKDRVTGLLVDEKNSEAIADSIIEIMENKPLRDDLSKNAHEFIQKRFSWDIISERFIKLYKKVGSKI